MSSKKNVKNSWAPVPKKKNNNNKKHYKLLQFFLKIYEEQFGIEYTPNMGKDLNIIKKIELALSHLGLEDDINDFLSWMVQNAYGYIEEDRCLTLHQYERFIDAFAQRDKKKDHSGHQIPSDPSFIKRLKQDMAELLIKDLAAKYGIPIATTAIYKASAKKNASVGNIKRVITKLFNNQEMDILLKIARQSIILSPYPKEFLMLDWRKTFDHVWQEISAKQQKWWREHDYVHAAPPQHYADLIS